MRSVVIISPGLKRQFDNIKNAGRKGLKPIGKDIEKLIRDRLKYQFSRQGDERAWKSLAKSTQKQVGGRTKPFATSQKKMWGALTKANHPNAYHIYQRHSIEVGEKGTVAPFHQKRRTRPGTAWVLPERKISLGKHTIERLLIMLTNYYSGKNLKHYYPR